MPFLQYREFRYPLRAGENRVGGGREVEVHLPELEEGSGDTRAIVSLSDNGSTTVVARSSRDTVVLNGVPVLEPTPLLHGDRLGVGPCELRFGDEGRLGETMLLDAGDVPLAVPSPSARASRTGGRLLSLVDGREYAVPPGGLSIGRDSSCDIVVGSPDVSRRHARIVAGESGYVLRDTSRNGVFVNEGRVTEELPLGRGDTIRVGRDEFRFYAEDHSEHDTPSVPSLQHTALFPVAKRPEVVQDATLPAAAPAPPDDASRAMRPVLGWLEVINEGPSRGTRHELQSPRVHVGRGEHNDVAINDESVSEYHAKLQRRGEAWYLLDLDSTNGTYVGGIRVTDEVPLASGSDVRFGGVKFAFHALASVARPSGETRVIVGVRAPDPKRSQPRLRAVPEQTDSTGTGGSGFSSILWLIVLVSVILVAYFVLQGGAR